MCASACINRETDLNFHSLNERVLKSKDAFKSTRLTPHSIAKARIVVEELTVRVH